MSNYKDRMIRVINYIHDNPTGDLSLDALADVAAMSRFHWHRVFRAMTGETCMACVKRIRMHLASVALVQTDAPVAQIGRDVGYPDSASFSRAFSDIYGQSPRAFRDAGQIRPSTQILNTGDTTMFDVELKDLPTRHLAAMLHKGPYPEISRAFQSVYAIIGASGMFDQIGPGVAVFHDDPQGVPAEDLRSHAGVALEEDAEAPDGLETYTIPGGRAAVIRYKGPYTGLPAVYEDLFANWLPGSGEEVADQPCYEVYLNDPSSTAPEDLLTDVVMPLR